MIARYKNYEPQIDSSAFIAPSASVVGRVEIGAESSVWFNATIRGDNQPVRIGRATSVQDNAIIHDNTVVGDFVTIGHGAIVHACTVGNYVLIGMGSIILDGAQIGEGAIIAAGSVVKVGTIVPPRSLFAGNPAVWKKDLKEETLLNNQQHAVEYARYTAEYLESGERGQYADQ
jgi:carbonic anhydrase/acetyltransferase-like protein (isoleucine patch superfamily)